MNRIGPHQAEDKGRPTAPLLIIGVAIALIYLPMTCGMATKVDWSAMMLRSF